MFTNNTKGYSLVEVLIAIAILLMALVGPMTIASKGLKSSYYAKEQATAIFLAQEGIEAFIAARNEYALQAFAAGDITTSWDWIASGSRSSELDKCFAGSGCNFDFQDGTPLDAVKSCSPNSACRLYFDETDPRAKYSLSAVGGEESPYTRIINVRYDSGGKGVIITSTVSWTSVLFSGNVQEVVLNGAIFSLYE